jgi:hypothetical protein
MNKGLFDELQIQGYLGHLLDRLVNRAVFGAKFRGRAQARFVTGFLMVNSINTVFSVVARFLFFFSPETAMVASLKVNRFFLAMVRKVE